jgi:hypothetical protein
MCALVPRESLYSFANITLKEHPVLRQLDELSQIPDQVSSDLSLLDTKGSQTTLDEVRFAAGHLQA